MPDTAAPQLELFEASERKESSLNSELHRKMLLSLIDQPVAISIRQPACDLVVKGVKDVENRTWPTRFRGPVFIHASKSFYPENKPQVLRNELPIGGIVGMAVVFDCITKSNSRWFKGKYGFLLRDASPLELTKCRGERGFFRPNLSSRDIEILMYSIVGR